MEIFELGIMREVKEVQLANAPHSILSIVDGIAMDFKEWQSEKRWSPIIIMDSDNTALSNEVQPMNALSLTYLTELGIIIDFNEEHP